MKAFVIGGAGFIGSHLCDALLNEETQTGKNQVVCIDNLSLGTRRNIAHLTGTEGFKFYEADASEHDELLHIFEAERPDYVFHLAANSDIQASASNPGVEYRNTYSTTFEILSCMRETGVKKLFFASTSAVYGDKRDVLLDENTPGLAPISYYGAAKLGSEALISAFSYMNDMDALVFRFPNVIGPRLTHGVIFDFIKKLQADPAHLRILGDGRQTKPYIYVSDLVDAIMQFKDAQGKDAEGKDAESKDTESKATESRVKLYNVGVEGATSVTKIADIICEEMGLSNVQYEYTGGEGGWKGDVPRFQYCIDKIHAAGWCARLDSDEAVRETVRRNLR